VGVENLAQKLPGALTIPTAQTPPDLVCACGGMRLMGNDKKRLAIMIILAVVLTGLAVMMAVMVAMLG